MKSTTWQDDHPWTAYRGEQDLAASLAPYDDLIARVAELPPPVPPELVPKDE
jgi:hypothetical protein